MVSDSPVPILAVDDQPENLRALEAILSGAAVELVSAVSGHEALNQLIDREFAVILISTSIPEQDGIRPVAAILSRAKTKSTPIIFLTPTHSDSMRVQQEYKNEAADYLSKPFIPEVLQSKVAVFAELFKKTAEVRRQADELSNYKNELERQLSELACAREDAITASRFKSEFLANVSHEIRTPMNGVLGMLEVLLGSNLNDNQRRQATTARDAAKSLLAVINDILDFSKIEAGKLTLHAVDFVPVSLVDSIVDLLSTQARQKSLTMRTLIDPDIPHAVRGDPGRLRQILTNLTGNAIKFSEDGEVVIQLVLESQDEQSVTIKFLVSDQGIGLAPDEIARIFQPFAQSSLSVGQRFGGTGLGLSISKRLVELMNGEIGVTSVKERGSTFWFTVTLEKMVQQTRQRPTKRNVRSARSTKADSETIRSELILVVEDHAVNQEVAVLLLKQIGFESHIAQNGRIAVEMLERTPYALVFMDWQMPEMDGLEATRQIRKMEHSSCKRTPIIAMTAHAVEGSRQMCLDAGMDDYISKPIDPRQLREALDKWLAIPSDLHSMSYVEADGVVETNLLYDRYKDHSQQIVDLFLTRDVPEQLPKLKAALDGRDLPQLLAIAHGLRGICGVVFATSMQTVCSEIEMAARLEDWETIAQLVPLLDFEFELARQKLTKDS